MTSKKRAIRYVADKGSYVEANIGNEAEWKLRKRRCFWKKCHEVHNFLEILLFNRDSFCVKSTRGETCFYPNIFVSYIYIYRSVRVYHFFVLDDAASLDLWCFFYSKWKWFWELRIANRQGPGPRSHECIEQKYTLHSQIQHLRGLKSVSLNNSPLHTFSDGFSTSCTSWGWLVVYPIIYKVLAPSKQRWLFQDFWTINRTKTDGRDTSGSRRCFESSSCGLQCATQQRLPCALWNLQPPRAMPEV